MNTDVTEHDILDHPDNAGQLVINWWLNCIWGTVGGLVLVAWMVHWIQVIGRKGLGLNWPKLKLSWVSLLQLNR